MKPLAQPVIREGPEQRSGTGRYYVRRRRRISTEGLLMVPIYPKLKVWTPLAFEYPEVIPCPHPIRDVKPVPYRPLRWDEYQ